MATSKPPARVPTQPARPARQLVDDIRHLIAGVSVHVVTNAGATLTPLCRCIGHRTGIWSPAA